MWDFVVLKHGHESSQGVGLLISMILIMSSTLQRTICKKIVKCCEVTLFF